MVPIPPKGTQEDQGQSDAARWCGDAGVDALRMEGGREDYGGLMGFNGI